jgi:hypothetical protein
MSIENPDKTLQHLVDRMKKHFDRIEAGEFDDMDAPWFEYHIRLNARHAKGSIFGISTLLIDSGLSDPDEDDRYSNQIDAIYQDAIARFKARKGLA